LVRALVVTACRDAVEGIPEPDVPSEVLRAASHRPILKLAGYGYRWLRPRDHLFG
jgi:hypothetical protein